MTALFTNNAFSTLASGITDSATTITLTATEGARFPSPTGSDFFYATLIDTSNNLEIVKCTTRSTDTLTVVRGQESTSAQAYSAGDRIELRVTAAGLTETVTASQAAQTAAEAAQTAAETVYDNFDDRYLGAKSSAPALDNDGNALLDGAMYFDTTENDMYVYDLGNTTWLTVSNSTSAAAAAAAQAAAEVAQAAAEAAQTAAEAAAAGIFWKEPALNATTANISLTGEQTIDGVLTSTSRILVKDQIASEENGVYVTAAGAWARAVPLDIWDEHVGAVVTVTSGSTYADTAWLCTVDAGGTLETTAITWAAYAAGGLLAANNLSDVNNAATSLSNIGGLGTAGNGLSSSGTTVNLRPIPIMGIALGAEDGALEAGTATVSFHMPIACTLTDAVADVVTAQTSGNVLTFDINEAGSTILSTKITIDNGEKTSGTAATPPVLSDTALAKDALITVDIDQIGDGTAQGGKIQLIGYPT